MGVEMRHQKVFASVDQSILIEILKGYIPDQNLIVLYLKLLEVLFYRRGQKDFRLVISLHNFS